MQKTLSFSQIKLVNCWKELKCFRDFVKCFLKPAILQTIAQGQMAESRQIRAKTEMFYSWQGRYFTIEAERYCVRLCMGRVIYCCSKHSQRFIAWLRGWRSWGFRMAINEPRFVVMRLLILITPQRKQFTILLIGYFTVWLHHVPQLNQKLRISHWPCFGDLLMTFQFELTLVNVVRETCSKHTFVIHQNRMDLNHIRLYFDLKISVDSYSSRGKDFWDTL